MAVEELGAYLQRKRNKALTVALQEMENKIGVTLNEMHQLEKDFLLYGEFDINSTKSIMELLDSLHNRTSTLENILEMKRQNGTLDFCCLPMAQQSTAT